MKATILDTKTGLIGVDTNGVRAWEWYENNWSCDCNRNLWGEPDNWWECNGCKRFLVIGAEYEAIDGDEVYTLAELNEGYPIELLAEHGILS